MSGRHLRLWGLAVQMRVVAFFCVFGLGAVAAHPGAPPLLSAVYLCLAITSAGFIGWCGPRQGIYVDESGCCLRYLVKRRTFAWSEVARFDLRRIGPRTVVYLVDRAGDPWRVPGVLENAALRDDSGKVSSQPRSYLEQLAARGRHHATNPAPPT